MFAVPRFGSPLPFTQLRNHARLFFLGIPCPHGGLAEDSGSLVYLGSLLTSDGKADSELSRRIGMASGDFKSLQRFLSHARVNKRRKLELLHALIISKLQYGLSTICLVKAQKRRLDGFYARCLRRVLGIPASFYSRVSDKDVFQRLTPNRSTFAS